MANISSIINATFSTDTPQHSKLSPWKLYDELIASIPEDITVHDYCLGTHWSYIEADCGMGVAFTCKGGGHRTIVESFVGSSLRSVAQLSKSWCFEEATLGVAALNAWYAQEERLKDFRVSFDEAIDLPDGTTRKLDAFELYRPQMSGRKVTVIGHFPHVQDIGAYADLTVLERNCRERIDTPDPACEYLLPSQDFVFITGVTIINKTVVRLLELCENATTIMVGPSVVPSSLFFERGVENLASSIVADPEKAKRGVMNGAGKLFGEAIRMASITQK